MLDVYEVLRLLKEEWTEWDWYTGRNINAYYITPKGKPRPSDIVGPGSKHVLILRFWGRPSDAFETTIRAVAFGITGDLTLTVDLHDPNSLSKLKQFIAKSLA